MARRATGLEPGGETGFRRLGYKNAINPRDLRALLDPQGDDAPFSLERLTERQRAALDELDALAPKLFLRAAEEKPCEKEVQFALGLDKQDKIERLRAIVARAFWRADSYATALAQLLDDVKDAEKFASQMDAFFKIIGGDAETPFYKGSPFRGLAKESAPYRAIEILNRRRLESATEKEERRDDITHGLTALESMRSKLRGVVEHQMEFGATPEDARFFFLLRLAEVFVIWTGRAPDFYHQRGMKKLGKKTEWLQLSTNALTLCGLGADRLDPLFRRLGGTGPRAEAYKQYANYRDLVDGLAQSIGTSIEWIKYIIEWELDPPNIKPDSQTATLRERLNQELTARGLKLEDICDLRKKASKIANGAETFLSRLLGKDPGLAEIFYSGRGLFCCGDLPSSAWLTDLGLAPEPKAYDD
jgi:hypothetical protein